MHSKSDIIEITMNDEADKITEEHFELPKKGYQNMLKESMKGREFVFGYFYLLYYKCNEINLNSVWLHIDPPDWIKSKKPNKKTY